MPDHSSRLVRAYKIPESVIVVIHTAELEVLLIERADRPGYWQSVTGSKDAEDEALMVTAAREVAEETGIVVGTAGVHEHDLLDWHEHIEYDIYPVWRHRYAPGVTRNVEHRFSLRVPRSIPVRLDPREHTRWRWLPLDEAAAACFSQSNGDAIRALPRHVGRGS